MILRHLIAFLLGFAIAGSVVAIKKAYSASLVNIFEMRFGGPGTPHVFPECSCTLRYVGTVVNGRRYSVMFDKLD